SGSLNLYYNAGVYFSENQTYNLSSTNVRLSLAKGHVHMAGDGIDDIVVGAPNYYYYTRLAIPDGSDGYNYYYNYYYGAVQVVFGSSDFPSTTLMHSSDLYSSSTAGFFIHDSAGRVFGYDGPDETFTANYNLGTLVATGDINGDGIDDVIF